MTRTLHLLRHGIAEPARALDADRARELTPAGVAGILALDERLRADGDHPPALVRCSPAVRAQQTLAHLGWAADAQVLLEERLYSGGPESVLGALADTPDDVPVVLLVGHDPTLSLLAAGLAHEDARGGPQVGLPPGGCATLSLPDDVSWGGIAGGTLTLVALRGM